MLENPPNPIAVPVVAELRRLAEQLSPEDEPALTFDA
jgi:hypothetical protein